MMFRTTPEILARNLKEQMDDNTQITNPEILNAFRDAYAVSIRNSTTLAAEQLSACAGRCLDIADRRSELPDDLTEVLLTIGSIYERASNELRAAVNPLSRLPR